MSFSNETLPRQLKGVIDRASSTGSKTVRRKGKGGRDYGTLGNSVVFPHLLVSAFSLT